MQVNSMQDYVTRKKRQVIAATYATTPPPQSHKTNSVYLSFVGNQATQRQRLVVPSPSAWGSVPGTATYTNFCTNCAAFTGAPGAFQTRTSEGGLRIQDLTLAMSP